MNASTMDSLDKGKDMGKIFFVMGKSSSGKDTIYRRLVEDEMLSLKTIVSYTTRPMREGEEEGKEYHFVDKEKLNILEAEGKVIERRDYNTVYGVWSYFTADDGQVELEKENYILIGTLESYEKIRAYYGKENVFPIYVNVEDGERLKRAIAREEREEKPRYEEMCRRFLADQKDFSDQNIKKNEIVKKYQNDNLERCINEIIEDIRCN